MRILTCTTILGAFTGDPSKIVSWRRQSEAITVAMACIVLDTGLPFKSSLDLNIGRWAYVGTAKNYLEMFNSRHFVTDLPLTVALGHVAQFLDALPATDRHSKLTPRELCLDILQPLMVQVHPTQEEVYADYLKGLASSEAPS